MRRVAPLRILVVDDHAAVRRAVCSLLRSQSDFEVVCEAADGLEAIQKAQELRPDVIVLDISMPELNGLQAARQIREVAPQEEIVFRASIVHRRSSQKPCPSEHAATCASPIS
jgi:DNA-binding NarL/FixJ family response regulator